MKLLGLREHPFAAGHDPRFLHSTTERDEALARLRHGLRGGESFLLVTGESGIGKTSLVCEALDDEGAAAAFVTQPTLEPRDLLEEVCIRFEIHVPKGTSKPQVMSRLERHLADLRSKGLLPVLALDDAQNASPELLEELRLLSNLEVEGRPMLQIVLMGLPELERRLGGPEMVRVRQRVATHCHLGPLVAGETEDYIHARVAAAGGDGKVLFPSDTCLEIHRMARGVPRAINTIAGEALLKASLGSAKSVSPKHVQSSATDSWLQSVSDGSLTGDVRSARAAAREEASMAAAAEEPRADLPRPTGDVNDWVSRFVDPNKPLRIGGQILAERAAEAARIEWEETHGPSSPGDTPALEQALPPRRHKRRHKALPGSRRGTRRGMRGRLPLAVGGLLVASVAVFLGVRWARRTPSETAVRPAANASGAVTRPAAETSPVVPAGARKNASLNPASSGAQSTASNPLVAPGPNTPPTAPVVYPRRGIETGSYLNAERAESERALLAETTGLPVRVIEGTEDGAAVYRVVVGSFGSRRKATAALDDLVARGLVGQARVVALPTETDSTTP